MIPSLTLYTEMKSKLLVSNLLMFGWGDSYYKVQTFDAMYHDLYMESVHIYILVDRILYINIIII